MYVCSTVITVQPRVFSKMPVKSTEFLRVLTVVMRNEATVGCDQIKIRMYKLECFFRIFSSVFGLKIE